LEKLKASLDHSSSHQSNATRISSIYGLLLISELVQRGVLISNLDQIISSDTYSEEEIKNILETIQQSVGKTLLGHEGTGNLSKSMCTNICALTGMVAEALAQTLSSFEITASATPGGTTKPLTLLFQEPSSPSLEKHYESVVAKCRELGDERFLALLLASSKSSISSLDKSKEINPTFRNYFWWALILRNAIGHYLRAAVQFSNPDQPLMWRRTLDVVLKLQNICQYAAKGFIAGNDPIGSRDYYEAYQISDASLPLSNLIRIALVVLL